MRRPVTGLPRPPKRGKFGAIRTVIPGVGTFDSKSEARQHGMLQLRERIGEISQLRRQPSYPLDVAGRHIAMYVADWEYLERGRRIAEDWKGVATREFKLKAKLFRALYPDIELRVTGPAAAKRNKS